MTKCDRCGIVWETKSKYVFVSCPSCYKKVKIREFKEVVGDTPTTNVSKEVKIPPEDIEQLLVLKSKGKTKDEIESAIDNNNDIEYSYEDLPDKVKKEIEK